MPQLVEITHAQTIGWQGLAEALAASGVEGTLVETSPGLQLALADGGSAGEVAHALEAWLLERGGGLLPQIVDDGHIVMRPPSA